MHASSIAVIGGKMVKTQYPESRLGKSVDYELKSYTISFVAFCSFFPCSLTDFIQGRQQKSGGRQQKSSRADKQHCFP